MNAVRRYVEGRNGMFVCLGIKQEIRLEEKRSSLRPGEGGGQGEEKERTQRKDSGGQRVRGGESEGTHHPSLYHPSPGPHHEGMVAFHARTGC